MTRPARIGLKVAVWGICLAPLTLLAYRAWTDDLGANPISFITNTLGDWTLRILLASLAMTPLRILFGLSWPITLRRLLGLFAFAYVCLHFAVWSVLDFFFDWPRMWADIVKRPYITMGMLALLSLIPLARDVDDRDDPTPRRAELDAPASSRVRRGGVRGPPLSVAREGRREGSVLVRGRAHLPARCPRMGVGTAGAAPAP